jgi:hypothetical protein
MWHHDLEVEDILGFSSPHGHSSSHSYARTSVSGSGSRGQSFEILHPQNDCPHCHAYKVHVINASLQDDPSLERDWTGTSPGYSESNLGFPPDHDIRRELYQVKTNLRRVRLERDEAVALNACYQNEVALLESQLQETKDRLLAVEMAYGDEAQWNINLFGEESRADELLREEAEQEDETLSSEDDSLDADLGMDDWAIEHPNIQTDDFSNASGSDSDDFELFQQHHLITQDEYLSEDDSLSNALQNQTSSTLDVYSTDSSIDSSIDSTSSLSCFSLSISDWTGNQLDDSSSSPAGPTSSNEELRRTKKLMASAHKEGYTSALNKVRKLIAESERTPRHERTEAQRYLLLNWRSPSRNNHSNLVPVQHQPAPAAYYPSSSNGRLEIYVDASGWGIGFVFGSRWLAWTFKKTRKIPLGGDGRMVMHWAELLAVEVGLRALIAAGHQSTTITVYSDNTGVIEALNKRSWCPQHGLEDSLQIILKLCGDYRIELRPRWVSTKDNLADMPSRGEFPGSLHFEYVPKLTKRLSDLLELAVA